jgi:hypothetical protein
MNPRLVLLLLALCAPAALLPAADFPGVKSLLSAAEWERAGLDRLTPDQLGIVDAALIRYLVAKEKELARPPATSTAATARSAEQHIPDPGMPTRSIWDRFGLPNMFSELDWRKQPPLRARVEAWVSANRFRLDNGQVWEGSEPIPYELAGKDIEIQARPLGQFALIVDGHDTKQRLVRLK